MGSFATKSVNFGGRYRPGASPPLKPPLFAGRRALGDRREGFNSVCEAIFPCDFKGAGLKNPRLAPGFSCLGAGVRLKACPKGQPPLIFF